MSNKVYKIKDLALRLDRSILTIGSVLDVEMATLDKQSKGIAIHE